MRELMSKPKVGVHAAGDSYIANNSGQADKEKMKILSFVNDDICSAILDVSFQRLLKKEKLLTEAALSEGPLQLWSDDLEGKGDFSLYRSRLVRLKVEPISHCQLKLKLFCLLGSLSKSAEGNAYHL